MGLAQPSGLGLTVGIMTGTIGEVKYGPMTETEEITFKMNRKGYPDGGGTFKCTCFLTSVSPSVSVGDVQAVSVSFQVNGKPEGGF